jgi:hypothetical protein
MEHGMEHGKWNYKFALTSENITPQNRSGGWLLLILPSLQFNGCER